MGKQSAATAVNAPILSEQEGQNKVRVRRAYKKNHKGVARGTYRMQRGWLDEPALRERRYCRRAAYCWLVEAAYFKSAEVVVGSTIVKLQAGQLTRSTRTLGEEWGWDESSVRRFLKRLTKAGLVRVEIAPIGPLKTAAQPAAGGAARPAAGQMVITICNYSEIHGGFRSPAAGAAAGTDGQAPHKRKKGELNKEKEAVAAAAVVVTLVPAHRHNAEFDSRLGGARLWYRHLSYQERDRLGVTDPEGIRREWQSRGSPPC